MRYSPLTTYKLCFITVFVSAVMLLFRGTINQELGHVTPHHARFGVIRDELDSTFITCSKNRGS